MTKKRETAVRTKEQAHHAGPGEPPHSVLTKQPIGCPKCLTLTAEFEIATGVIEYGEALNLEDEELADAYPAEKYICTSCFTRILLEA